MSPSRLLALLAALAIAVAMSCSSSDPTPTAASGPTGEVTVFAASSLTDAFNELATAFQAKYPGTSVTYNFAGTSTLRSQLEQGAQADVFASANQAHMQAAAGEGLIEGDPSDFASNRLAVITPVSDPKVTSLADLTKSGVLLALALPDVPVGGYARQALTSLGGTNGLPADYSDQVLANLVSQETNVRQVVAKVALGEADAGIVYQTDITADVRDQLAVIDIPADQNVIASYPIAQVADAKNPDGGAAFVAFVLSADGQAILAKYGFGGPAQ